MRLAHIIARRKQSLRKTAQRFEAAVRQEEVAGSMRPAEAREVRRNYNKTKALLLAQIDEL